VQKYDVNVVKINDNRFEICGLNLPLSEINDMLTSNIITVPILLIIDSKMTSLTVFLERNVYNDIRNKKDGKYNLLSIGYAVCSDTDVTFEKRLIDKNYYQLVSNQDNFDKFGMMIFDYITVQHDVVEYHKILFTKSVFDSINKKDLFHKFSPMLVDIEGNKFKIVDVLIHTATLANILYDKYTSIRMKPIITVTSSVYYEYALIVFPIHNHLININICDPFTLASTNVILDETSYLKLYDSNYKRQTR
jgi:hypothetical protein